MSINTSGVRTLENQFSSDNIFDIMSSEIMALVKEEKD